MPYARLGIALSINAVIMFFLTYAALAEVGHFQANLNRFYMALLMVAPMGMVMLIVMRPMYQDDRLSAALGLGFVVIFFGSLFLIRTQMTIGNDQFLRSMIPHHSSAILMCEEASISDPEISELCDNIIQSQREEIAQMKALLND